MATRRSFVKTMGLGGRGTLHLDKVVAFGK